MTSSVQSRLNEIYAALVDRELVQQRLHRIAEPDKFLSGLWGPFLIASDEQYEQAELRIIIVGKENNGWMDDNYLTFLQTGSLEQALHEYRNFDFDTRYRSTFFQYFSKIRDEISGVKTSPNRSALWLNVFKLNAGMLPMIQHPELETILDLERDILRGELEILKPDVVIFLTGPHYDSVVSRLLDARPEPVDGLPENAFARLRADVLPMRSFRTYHPSYMNRIRARKPEFYNKLIELAKN